MSLVWSIIYSLLWAEIGFLTLLLLPYISTHWWCRLVTSARPLYDWADRLLGITWYFWCSVSILAIVFLNCLREVQHFNDIWGDHKDEGGVDHMTLQKDAINVFRSQRNIYISGLALFLALVIKRVLSLILKLGEVRTQREDLKADQVAQVAEEKIEAKKEN